MSLNIPIKCPNYIRKIQKMSIPKSPLKHKSVVHEGTKDKVEIGKEINHNVQAEISIIFIEYFFYMLYTFFYCAQGLQQKTWSLSAINFIVPNEAFFKKCTQWSLKSLLTHTRSDILRTHD